MPSTRALRELPALFGAGGGSAPRTFFAPGRANLLGSHLDYNGGAVVPVALSRGTYGAFALRADGRLRMRSVQFGGGVVERRIAALVPGRERGWPVYLEGAVWAASQAWGTVPGLDAAVSADLPIARGLSSSASVTVLALTALAALLGRAAGPEELVRLAHEAETGYAGVRCGVLDQAAILHARENSALLFDCLHQTREYLPLDAGAVRVAVMDTGVRRELAGSAFNQRVAECTRALVRLQELAPGLTCLREVTPALLEAGRDRLAPVLARRVQHVVEEVARTARGAGALRKGDLAGFGAAMSAAQDSLRELYEVSTPELDALTAAARRHPGCYGSRLTGAGFGGCAVALVHPAAAEDFERAVPRDYRQATGRGTRVAWFRPAGGPREIAAPEDA